MSNEEAVKMLRTMQRTVYLGNRKFEDAIECAIKALSEPLQPWEVLAAQVVLPEPEIVRCKDCKHWIPYDWMFSEIWQSKNREDYPEDDIGCDCSDMAMKADDFCSRAERREVAT